MDGSFPGIMNHPVRGDLNGAQMVIQQYSRYTPGLEVSLQSASSVGSGRSSRLAASASPPLHRKETPRSLQPSPRGQRSGIPPPSVARSGASMSPPPLDPLRQRHLRDSVDLVESRSLPSRDVTNETIDDAYVAFILYCNPNVPLSVDTLELRKAFRSPPRSDGKSFSVFALWELIQKLDRKEIKTWIQLAIELGVEPPSLEKKQSTQKVQQYAVRLKRWMRAMHVDAFFVYCLGHAHPYYTQLPPPGSLISDGRDGVPLEEDLALRALVPEWKPKRGRKRAEEKEGEVERSAKRPQVDTSAAMLHPGNFPGHPATFPQSAIPFSAFPDDMEANDPWMTVASSFPPEGPQDIPTGQQGQEYRWRPLEREVSPVGYPQSAIIPRGHHPADNLIPNEPQSAITPSSGERSRARRRHGPAVSSAWPGSQSSSTGKARGRPPNRASATGGSLSSYPSEGSEQSQVGGSPAVVQDNDTPSHVPMKHYQSHTPFQQLSARPSKLQLQVPQRVGAPVRLATPPTLLVNGTDNASPFHSNRDDDGDPTAPLDNLASVATGVDTLLGSKSTNDTMPNITPDHLIRVFSAELLRYRLVGRPSPLSSDEARTLAISVVTSLTASYSGSHPASPAVMSAIHLGLGNKFGFPCAAPDSATVRISTTPSGNNSDGTGLLPLSGRSNALYTICHEYKLESCALIKTICSGLSLGRLGVDRSNDAAGTEDLDGLSDADFFEGDYADSNTSSEATWKQRYMRLRAQMQKRDRALSQYKRKILESVMAEI